MSDIARPPRRRACRWGYGGEVASHGAAQPGERDRSARDTDPACSAREAASGITSKTAVMAVDRCRAATHRRTRPGGGCG